MCDNFLTANQQILNEKQWQALQMQWMSAGQAVECTSSQSIGEIKAEIEKLCSKVSCDYQIQKTILDGLNKVLTLGDQSRSLMMH